MKLNRVIRILVCCLLACVMLAPMDAEGAKKKKRAKATTTATTKKKKNSRTTASSSSRRSRTSRTVTQATREAAINASQSRSAQRNARNADRDAAGTKSAATAGSKSKKGALTKLEVEKPDLEQIRVSTLDPKNKFYFPKLMEKYQRNDTTMTPEEYRYLYLGYMFQEDYDPYRVSPYSSVTDELRDKEKYTRAEIDTIRKYAEKALEDNPFDLRQMSFLVHVLKERRKDMSAKIWEYRLEHLLGAIKSTGTGQDEDNAWFVIYPMHEYDLVQLLGYRAVDVDYIEPGFDHLLVEPDGSVKMRNPADGFYFNVQVLQQQYELKHPEEADEG